MRIYKYSSARLKRNRRPKPSAPGLREAFSLTTPYIEKRHLDQLLLLNRHA
jgi:hypothetical protein